MIGQENSDGQFEQEWKEVFGDASQTPPDAVWNEIDRKLAYAELSVYKAKASIYRWAVAAVLLLAASLGTLQYWYFQQRQDYQLAINVDKPDPQKEVYSIRIPESFGERATVSAVSAVDHEGSHQSDSRASLLVANEQEDEGSDQSYLREVFEELPLTKLKPQVSIAANYSGRRLYLLPVYHFEQKRKSDKDNKYWAGLSLGSGGFDPNFQSTGGSLLASNLDVASAGFSLSSEEAIDSQSPSVREGMLPGESVSLGVNFGLKLSDRWTLESGVQYARADATTQTNVVIQTSTFQEVIPATSQVRSVQQFEQAIERQEVVEYDYRDVNLKNEFQFTSVPVKAGYLVLNSKFKLELNAGVIANFYMGNKLSGSDSEIAGLTIGPGSESPYREVSFSGLAGVEFGYQLLKNFDLVIEPNYRRSINSLTKENTSFSTNPSGFGLLTGVRYNFN
ncbi:hypothetical protein [Marinoscillum sp.]|uniref:hypothetical protein n=1 Tax=Marinoscillum sp. TaxID=2024838 RepID=UPI003BA9DA5B